MKLNYVICILKISYHNSNCYNDIVTGAYQIIFNNRRIRATMSATIQVKKPIYDILWQEYIVLCHTLFFKVGKESKIRPKANKRRNAQTAKAPINTIKRIAALIYSR